MYSTVLYNCARLTWSLEYRLTAGYNHPYSIKLSDTCRQGHVALPKQSSQGHLQTMLHIHAPHPKTIPLLYHHQSQQTTATHTHHCSAGIRPTLVRKKGAKNRPLHRQVTEPMKHHSCPGVSIPAKTTPHTNREGPLIRNKVRVLQP